MKTRRVLLLCLMGLRELHERTNNTGINATNHFRAQFSRPVHYRSLNRFELMFAFCIVIKNRPVGNTRLFSITAVEFF